MRWFFMSPEKQYEEYLKTVYISPVHFMFPIDEPPTWTTDKCIIYS